MTLDVAFRAAARREFIEAIDWYEAQRSGLGAEFLGEVRGRALLAERVLHRNWTIVRASSAAGVSIQTARKWVRRFKEEGRKGLIDRSSRPHHLNTRNMPAGPALQESVLALLHTPPSQHGLNRTTWRLVDLRETLSAKGTTTSIRNISAVIGQAGYRYKQARIAGSTRRRRSRCRWRARI
jgi:transposase